MATSPSTLAREAGTSVRAVRTRRRRPSLSHILIFLAVVLAFGLNYLALSEKGAVVTVAVAADDLLAGSAFDSGDVRLTASPADMEGVGFLVHENDLAGLDGWILTRSLAAGELVDKASLIPPATGAGQRLMSIPVATEHAAGALISPGDRVDVISVEDDEARFVALNLEVVQAADANGGALGSLDYFVVVAVDPEDAVALAAAIDRGSVEILRSTGAAPIGQSG